MDLNQTPASDTTVQPPAQNQPQAPDNSKPKNPSGSSGTPMFTPGQSITPQQFQVLMAKLPAGTDYTQVRAYMMAKGYKFPSYTPPATTPFGTPNAAAQGNTAAPETETKGAVQDTGNVLLGALKSIPNTVVGLGSMFSAIPKAIGNKIANTVFPGTKSTQPQVDAEDQAASDAINNYFAPKNTAQKVGQVGGDIAQLFAPGSGEADLLKGADEAINGLGLSSKMTKGIQLGLRVGLKTLTDSGLFKAQGASNKEAIAGGIGGGLIEGASPLWKSARETVSGIEPNIKTALQKTTMSTLDNYLDAAANAVKDSSAATPLEMVGKKAEGIVEDLSKQLDTFGKAKNDALQEVKGGVKVADKTISGAEDLFTKFRSKIESQLGVTLGQNGEITDAPGRASRITAAGKKLVADTWSDIEKVIANPTVQIGNDAVDSIQAKVYAAGKNLVEPVTDETTSVMRRVAGDLNKAVTDSAGKAYQEANKGYSKIIGARDDLNEALGEKGDKGASLMKQVFSPSGAKAKRILAQIKNLTGIDLTQETVIAKFAMDAAGDTRQSSILKELGVKIPTSASGLVEKTVNGIVKMLLNNPEKAAKAIISGG